MYLLGRIVKEYVGWGEERTPTSPYLNSCWGSFLTPAYGIKNWFAVSDVALKGLGGGPLDHGRQEVGDEPTGTYLRWAGIPARLAGIRPIPALNDRKRI